MKRLCFFLIANFFFISLIAQVYPKELKSSWDFLDDSQQIIEISYDLPVMNDTRYFTIYVKGYVDDKEIPMKALRGDIGDSQKVEDGKAIQWDWSKDVVEISGNLNFKVFADDPLFDVKKESTKSKTTTDSEPVKINKVPILAGFGGIMVAGGGLLIAGLGQESSAQDLYDIYKNDTNPNSSTFSDQSRQEVYDDANSKHKKAQLLMIGGGVVFAGAAYLLFSRLKAIKELEKSNVFIRTNLDQMNSSPDLVLENYGISIVYKF